MLIQEEWHRQTREDVTSAIACAHECGEDVGDAAIQEVLLALSKYPDFHPEFRYSMINLYEKHKKASQ